MIHSITVTNYLGESITIDMRELDPKHGLLVKSIDGLGPPKATINMTKLATNDGSLYNSARLEERNIVLRFIFAQALTIEETRQRTYRMFPIKKPVTLLIETDNRVVTTTGYVESNEPDIFSSEESNTISILFDDPYFYSSGNNGINETIFYGIDPLFEFEFENDSLEEPTIEFGSIENETEKNVFYEGDAEIGIVITIHSLGDVGNITIYNTGTREVMRIDASKIEELTGSGIIAGDDIIIDTTRGNKSVLLLREGYYTNILNCIGRDSDWFLLSKGDNIFAYIADSGSENLQFKIENRVIYEGV